MGLLTKNSYEDNNGNLHYANYRTNVEYIVPLEKKGIFKVLNERYFLALALSLVLAGFKVPIYLCIVAGIIAVLFLSLFRNQKFLPQLQSKKLDSSRKRTFEKKKSITKDKCINIILISLIIICFALLNNYYQNYQETNLQAFILSWAVSGISFLNILKQISILKTKKGGNQ